MIKNVIRSQKVMSSSVNDVYVHLHPIIDNICVLFLRRVVSRYIEPKRGMPSQRMEVNQ